jgi:hypothetical protein
MRRAKHVMLAAIIALPMPTANGEAQEIGQPSRGLVLAQRLCAECHAVQKEYSRSPNANAPRFQAIASIPGMTAIGRAQSQHHAARRPAGRHHRLYSEPQMTPRPFTLEAGWSIGSAYGDAMPPELRCPIRPDRISGRPEPEFSCA